MLRGVYHEWTLGSGGRSMRALPVLLAAFLVMFPACELPGPAESGWRIELIRELELAGGDASVGGMSRPNDLAVDSRGRYYTASGYAPATLQVLDSAGRLLTTFGRRGRGPSEFLSASTFLVGDGDTLHVFDARAGTYARVSLAYEPLRRTTIGAQVLRNRVVQLAPDRFVFSANVPTPERLGYTLHFLEDGAPGASLGERAPLQDDGRPEPFSTARVLASDGANGFLAAHVADYVIERWSVEGEMLDRLAVDAPWFVKEDRSTPRGRFNPMIRAMWVDQESRIWVLASVRSEAFDDLAKVVGRMPGTQGDIPIVQSRTGDEGDLERYVLEVIDPVTGQSMATAGVPASPQGFLPDGRIWTSRNDDTGGTIEIWQARLVEGEG